MFKNLSPAALGVSGHQSEIIELALTYGFTGMDLNVTDFATRVRLKGLDYAKRLMVSAKIHLGCFPLPTDWATDDATFQKEVAKLGEYAQAAAQGGCTRAVAIVAPADAERPYHENFEFHRRRFHEICKALQPSGVRLGIGFRAPEYLRKNQAFQFIHDLDALTLLLNMVDAPNIGLLLDVWEVVAAGGSLDTIRKIPAKQLVAVRIADMAAGVPLTDLDDKSRLLPGAENSRIDIPAFLTYLKEVGYDGPVTPVPSRAALTSRRRDIVVKQVGESLDRVWRAAGLPNERRFVPTAAAD
jgi:sugar phosphate isomerase/epimerase